VKSFSDFPTDRFDEEMTHMDHTYVPRQALTRVGLHDLATVLIDGRPVGAIPFRDLGQLIAQGPAIDIDARAIKIARDRLTETAQRGNAGAARVLAELAEIERGNPVT
jgi:hypothetical protein